MGDEFVSSQDIVMLLLLLLWLQRRWRCVRAVLRALGLGRNQDGARDGALLVGTCLGSEPEGHFLVNLRHDDGEASLALTAAIAAAAAAAATVETAGSAEVLSR